MIIKKGALGGRFGKRPTGLELVEILPVILGGNPDDPGNKTWVTREQHFEIVRYWNGVIGEQEMRTDHS